MWRTPLGTRGNGVNQFSDLLRISVDGAGRIYLADYGLSGIARVNDMTGVGRTTLGSPGSGVYEFSRPSGISVDAAGKIYVADKGNNRIVRIDN